VRPEYGWASLSDVAPGVLNALGVPGSSDPLRLAAGPLHGVRSAAILLIDGLGFHLLPVAARYAPTLAALLAGEVAGTTVRSITTGFPTTTPTSLTSLGTGAAPGGHGVVGFSVNVPGTDRVLNHIRWDDDPDPFQWQPLPTQFERAQAAGLSTVVVSRPEYEGSGLTTSAFRGGLYKAAADTDEVADAMLRGLVNGRTLVYGYYPDVDTLGHEYGVGSPHWRYAVLSVDRLLTRLITGLPPTAGLVITADHGQINVPADRRFDIDTDPRLRDGVRVVAGEPRVRYVHTRPGATADVIATWRGVLGEAAWVVSREEAVAAGWFGDVPEAHLLRIGEVVVACNEDYVIQASLTSLPRLNDMIAFHGSATETEMRVPLITVRGSALL
jgi:hypothetical protein